MTTRNLIFIFSQPLAMCVNLMVVSSLITLVHPRTQERKVFTSSCRKINKNEESKYLRTSPHEMEMSDIAMQGDD